MRANFPFALRPYPETTLIATDPDDVFTLNANSGRPNQLANPVRFTMRLDTSIMLAVGTYLTIRRVDSAGTDLEVHRVNSGTVTDFVIMDSNLGGLLGTGENFIARVHGVAWAGKTAITALQLGLDR